jgi:hypothetical protein
MRYLSRVAAAAGAAALVLTGTAAAVAQAGPGARTAPVVLRGGRTTVTTGRGIALALLANGIVPIAVSPGSGALRANLKAPAVRYSFPVTGGRVSLSPLGGRIAHRGGILFFDTKTGKDLEVSNFVISVRHADLTGIVNGNPRARVVLMWLDFSHARLHVHGHRVIASHIGLKLSSGAASALDTALGTTLFTGGLKLGTATTVLRI